MPFDFSVMVVSWWCMFHLLPSPPTGFPCGSAAKESACNAGDVGSTPGLGKSPGEGKRSIQFSSVAQSCPTLCDPHGLQHTRPPCPSPTPSVYSDSCPLSRWCHPTLSSSVIPFFCLQSFPASGSFQMSQFFASVGQRIGVSASTSVLPVNTEDWSPLGWIGWISLQFKGLSRVFSNTTVQKHQFFSA